MKFSNQDEETLQRVITKYGDKSKKHISITECMDYVNTATECVDAVKRYIEFYRSSPFKPEEPVLYNGKTYLVSQLYRTRDADGSWQWTACDLVNNKAEITKEVNISDIQPYSPAAKVLFGKGKVKDDKL